MLAFATNKMPNKRIYVGIREICDTTLQISKGFRELGFDVTNVVMDQSYNQKRPYGREGYRHHDSYIRSFHNSNNFIYIADLTKEFLKRTPRHDVFIFNAGTTFYGDFVFKKGLRHLSFVDLPIFQKLGKTVGVIANGSELRSNRLYLDELKRNEKITASHLEHFQKYLEEHDPIDDTVNRTRAKKLQKYADEVFVKEAHSQYLDTHSLYFPPIDPKELNYSNNDRDIPLVIHAPTDKNLKGTKYVTKAVDKLKTEGYEFDFELVEGLSNEKFRKKLTESDVVVDQVLFPGYGLLAAEAMATGNAVLGCAIPGFHNYPEDIPMMTTTPDSVYRNLKEIIGNKNLRKNLAQRGRPFIEENNHYLKLSEYILDRLGIKY